MTVKLDFLGMKGKQKKILSEVITFELYFNNVCSKNLKHTKFLLIF